MSDIRKLAIRAITDYDMHRITNVKVAADFLSDDVRRLVGLIDDSPFAEDNETIISTDTLTRLEGSYEALSRISGLLDHVSYLTPPQQAQSVLMVLKRMSDDYKLKAGHDAEDD